MSRSSTPPFFRKLILHIGLIFLALFTSVQIATATASAAITAPEKVRLQLKWFNQFQFAGYIAAREKGFYAEEGLDVEILERNLNKSVTKQVVAGEAEYGIGDSGLLSQYAENEPIIALAAIFQHNPLVFFARQDSDIVSPYEVKGKRIQSDIASANEAPLRAMLSGASIKESDYTLLPQRNDYSLLISKKVDIISGYLTDEPFYFKQKGLKVNIINPQNYGIDFYGDTLFTSKNELLLHPDRVEKFRRASIKGWRYAMDHPEELIQIIARQYHSKLTIPHLRFEADEMRKLILPDEIPLGQIQADRLKKLADVYAASGHNRQLSETEITNFIYKSNQATSLTLTDEEKQFLVAHPVLRVGVDFNFAPYEWIDEKGNYVGMAADYMHALEKKLGVHFEIIQGVPWAEILNMAKQGQLDMLACAANTPERSQYLNFSEPFKKTFAIIIDNGKGDFIGNLRNLNNKRVALEKGYFMEEMIRTNYPLIEIVPTNSTQEALNLVMQGKAEAYVGDEGVANYEIKQHGLLTLRFSGQTEYLSQHAVATSKTHPLLASIIKKAMDSMSLEETNEISNRWVGLKIEPGIRTSTIVKYAAGLSLLFALFAYWIYRLRSEISKRKIMEAQVKKLAFYDPLTQLANRNLLNDRLSQVLIRSKRSHLYGALMFIDLDNFKPLNDLYGHTVGDLLLVEVAQRLRSCVREIDTVGRFGGDEFVVIISQLSIDQAESTARARILAEKISAILAAPYLLSNPETGGEIEHRCTASIGVAIFIDHLGNENDFMRWADGAMYLAKESGRNAIQFYQPRRTKNMK
jgi:diguanylate cyclase (GGDEF)-like protein